MHADDGIYLVVEGIAKMVPFYKLLGLTRDCFDADNACIRFPWRDEYTGNPVAKIMHGGVISAILDAEGGFILGLHYAKGLSSEEIAAKWSGTGGTIDLRVDYLLPGKGRHFVASGHILRFGNKVAVARMELHNDEQQLIAVGTGTYMIG